MNKPFVEFYMGPAYSSGLAQSVHERKSQGWTLFDSALHPKTH